MHALSQRVGAVLARERGLAAGCRVIEVKRVKFVGPRRSDRQVRISPAIGSRQDFLENSLALSIDQQIAPELDDGLAK